MKLPCLILHFFPFFLLIQSVTAQDLLPTEKPEPTAGTLFGWNATLSESGFVFISSPKLAPNGTDSVGGVHVYRMFWDSQPFGLRADTLLIPDSTQIAWFGADLTTNESFQSNSYKDYLFVSALKGPDSLNNAGAIFTYKKTAGHWELIQVISGSDTEAGDYFGASVTSQNYEPVLFSGAYYADGITDSTGAVYVFSVDSTGLVQKQKLMADDGQPGDRFGYSVEVEYETLLIGAPSADGRQDQSGAVYVFKKHEEEWIQTQKLTDPLGTSGDEFGYTISRQTYYAVLVKQRASSTDYYPFYVGAPGKQHEQSTGSVFLMASHYGMDSLSIGYELTSDTTNHTGFGKSVTSYVGEVLIPETSNIDGSGIIHRYRFISPTDTVYHSYFPDNDTRFPAKPEVFTTDYLPIALVGIPLSSRDGLYESGDINGFYTISTSNEDEAELPQNLDLYQNYPNPFNPVTVISYQLPVSNLVQLKVYDILGREVAELVNSVQTPGLHEVRFDASRLSSGVYLYRLTAGNQTLTKKMMLIK